MDEATQLLLAARGGDRACLTAWIRGSQAEVHRVCAHLVDQGAADDLTQETYVRAHRALAAYRGDASSRTWLLAIARRVCADEIRRRQRGRRLVERLAATAADRDEVSPDAAGAVDLWTLLAALGPDQREAFVLTQVGGLSYAEAADACEVAVGTIRSRVARARERLSAALHDPVERGR